MASVLQQHGQEQHGPHAAELLNTISSQSSTHKAIDALFRHRVKTLYAWKDPVSPHIAVETEGRAVSDGAILQSIIAHLNEFGHSVAQSGVKKNGGVAIVETAGGVGSPGPNRTLQCDLLRPLRLPALLVGDGRLGGISTTVTSYESLIGRGYDVPLIVLMDPERKNWKAIQRHVGSSTSVIPFSGCQPPPSDGSALPESIPGVDAHLKKWLDDSQGQFDELIAAAHDHHSRHLEALRSAAQQAKQVFWWPFTQHGSLGNINVVESRAGERYAVFTEEISSLIASPKTSNSLEQAPTKHPQQQGMPAVTSTSQPAASTTATNPKLSLEYDACASWWTQGVSQEALPSMARAIGYATARYGHIIFPQTVHEPALKLAQRALEVVGGSWASRAFFSDDGSTAVEVALKMAFRKYAVDQGLVFDGKFSNGNDVMFGMLGLQEAYHGDTLGAMDAVPPSPFNGPMQTPWFTGRGVFLDAPTLGMKNGVYEIFMPSWAATIGAKSGEESTEKMSFASLEEAFSSTRNGTALSLQYRDHIEDQIDQYLGTRSGAHVAACIMEPVLQGAGGMRLIDPEFQRAMAAACKARGIPIILDEVFTGFWRLGVSSAASMLGVLPDIACYAKLLTGGVVPMALTLASEAVFKSFEGKKGRKKECYFNDWKYGCNIMWTTTLLTLCFMILILTYTHTICFLLTFCIVLLALGDSKAYALLHGHSYTAHPIGCSAAVHALETFTNPALNPNLCTPEVPGRCCKSKSTSTSAGTITSAAAAEDATCSSPCGKLLSIWDESRLAALSHRPNVERVIGLGTVAAVELRSDEGAGYGSSAASGVVAALKQKGIIARPLGNVVYVMVTPMTTKEQSDAVLRALEEALD